MQRCEICVLLSNTWHLLLIFSCYLREICGLKCAGNVNARPRARGLTFLSAIPKTFTFTQRTLGTLNRNACLGLITPSAQRNNFALCGRSAFQITLPEQICQAPRCYPRHKQCSPTPVGREPNARGGNPHEAAPWANNNKLVVLFRPRRSIRWLLSGRRRCAEEYRPINP